jgi:hypothetical protein
MVDEERKKYFTNVRTPCTQSFLKILSVILLEFNIENSYNIWE